MNDYITIGEIIRHYRKERGLSQEELSNGICDRKHLSHVENNKTIPTLDIINQLSQKLQTNLYETYALMLRHHDIETHKKIENINQCFDQFKLDTLLTLISEYEQLETFQHGEPKQYLIYAKTVYTSNKLHDQEKSIQIALEEINSLNGFSLNYDDNTCYLSNVELSLLLALMVNYFRIGDKCEGRRYYQFLYEYITHLFSVSHYATNRNEQFELRFLSKIVYNYFIFLKDESDFNITHIDNTLALMKSLHSHCMLPELLLCKAYLQTRDRDLDGAKQNYSLAHQLGLYLYSEGYQKHIERTTLLEHFDTLTEVL